MNIGLAVREASVGTNATLSGHLTATEEDEADEREALVPAGLVRRFLRFKSRNPWVYEMAVSAFAARMAGVCSVRAVRAAVHWSVGRAVRQARRPKEKRTGLTWSIRCRDGWLTREGELQPV